MCAMKPLLTWSCLDTSILCSITSFLILLSRVTFIHVFWISVLITLANSSPAKKPSESVTMLVICKPRIVCYTTHRTCIHAYLQESTPCSFSTIISIFHTSYNINWFLDFAGLREVCKVASRRGRARPPPVSWSPVRPSGKILYS